MMNRWFTRYLFGVQNGVEENPKAWIVREGDDMRSPTPYPDYPNPAASPVRLYPGPGAPGIGSLSRQQASAGRETLTDDYSYSGEALARAETSENRLLYLTPELQADLHISGVPEITVKLASSKPAANLSVWMVSLPWNTAAEAPITDNIITRGWADPQNHASLTEGEPLVPGAYYEVTFELMPDDQIIPKGQKIGLMIFSSDREFTLWPEPGTQLTIDLGGTHLDLPVVGGEDALDKAFVPDSGNQ